MKGLQNRVLGIFLGIFFSIVIAPALAHDPSHPELNGWFNRLASGKGLCCSFADGYVVADADWETRDGHYKVRIPKIVGSADMEWIDVSRRRFDHRTEPGGTHDGLADAVRR